MSLIRKVETSIGALAVLASLAAAQSSSVLQGRVVDSLDHRIPFATVWISPPVHVVRADSAGEFTLGSIPAGLVTINIRRIGFTPLAAQLRFSGTDTLQADFELAANARELLPVTVAAKANVRGLYEFERRRRANVGGTFLTREALQPVEQDHLSDVLRRVIPGVQFIFDARQGRIWMAGGRGSSGDLGKLPNGDPADPKSPRACYVQVYVDGAQIYAPSAVQASSPAPDIDSFLVSEIAGIEFYRGPATTPPEMGGTGASCGTLVIWSRTQ